jgi:tetratricopeptide (TPR) repeat protein
MEVNHAGTVKPRAAQMGSEASAVTDVRALAERVRALCLTDVGEALMTSERGLLGAGADAPGRAALVAARAHALCYANRFGEAVELLEDAARRAGTMAQDDFAMLHQTMVQPLARLGRLDEAELHAETALAMLKRAGSNAGKAAVNLAIVQRMRGKFGAALESFAEAEGYLSGDNASLAALESNRAEALLDLDRHDEARRAFERAHASFVRAGHAQGAAIVAGNLADLCSRMGLIDEALARFSQARGHCERAGMRGDAARLTGEEGEALLAGGALRKSVRLYQQATPVLRDLGMMQELARCLLGLGQAQLRGAWRRPEVLARASACFREALDLAGAISADAIAHEARLCLAEAMHRERRYDESERLAREARAGLEGRVVRMARADGLLAEIALSRGEASRAMALADEALAYAGESVAMRSRLRHARARALASQGRESEAWDDYARAIADAEVLRGAIRAEQMRTAFTESAAALFEDALATALSLGGGATATRVFDLVERMRARALLEACSGRPARGETAQDAELAHELDELNALYREVGALGRAPRAGRAEQDAAKRLREVEARLERRRDAAEGAGSGSGVLAPRSLSRVQGALRADVCAVSFFGDGDAIGAMVIAAGGVRVRRRIAMRAELGTLARRVRLEVDRAVATDAPADPRVLVRVHASVLGALREDIEDVLGAGASGGGGHVVLSLSPELHHLPMASAAHVAHDWHWDVTLAPSVGVGAALREAADREDRGGALVVGVSDELGPAMEDEAEGVARALPGATLLLGEAARADAVLAGLERASIAHLACHGVFDGEFAMSSRVRMNDRWVTARELAGRVRRGAMVVLAGCDTGAGDDAYGQDRFGLVRALLASGASGVVAASWRLHDAYSARAMPEIVASARAGMANGETEVRAFGGALARANRDGYESGESWHLWASLTCTGALP